MFGDISEKVKEATKKRKEVSQTISNQESVRQTKQEINSLSEDLKTIEKKLSGYLEQYVTTYKTRTIEASDGKLKEIITVYKLINRINPE